MGAVGGDDVVTLIVSRKLSRERFQAKAQGGEPRQTGRPCELKTDRRLRTTDVQSL